jgi:hypothetical protein
LTSHRVMTDVPYSPADWKNWKPDPKWERELIAEKNFATRLEFTERVQALANKDLAFRVDDFANAPRTESAMAIAATELRKEIPTELLVEFDAYVEAARRVSRRYFADKKR